MKTMPLILILTAKFMMETENPVKLSLQVLSLSAVTFLTMFLISSKSWFSMIYFMLFLGGVLIMFMILSSLLPNEGMEKTQSLKESVIKMMIMVMMVSVLFTEKSFGLVEPEMSSKMGMSSSIMMVFLMLLILLYFIIFIGMIMGLKIPMRSQKCHKISIL